MPDLFSRAYLPNRQWESNWTNSEISTFPSNKYQVFITEINILNNQIFVINKYTLQLKKNSDY